MAITITDFRGTGGTRIVKDTAATATAVNNASGATGTLYMVEIDNASYSTAVYFKLADATSATAGTTAADIVLKCPASSTKTYVFPGGIAFSNGFSHWCTTGAAESSTAAPADPPTVTYIT